MSTSVFLNIQLKLCLHENLGFDTNGTLYVQGEKEYYGSGMDKARQTTFIINSSISYILKVHAVWTGAW